MTNSRTWKNLIYTIWDVFWIRLDCFFSTLRSRFSLAWQGCKPGEGFTTTGKCSFKARASGSISIGKQVSLLASWRSNRVGLSSPVLLQTFAQGQIYLGDHSGGSAVIISSRSEVRIGKFVNLGGNVRIYDHDFHALEAEFRRLPMNQQSAHIRSEPIFLGDDVFVGANSIILKGVSLGDRCIVAAGSVVFRGNYPADCLLAGNPAQVVSQKKRNSCGID